MEDLQKVIEELNMKLSNEMGHTAYWKGMAGTYRNENHKHLQQLVKARRWNKILLAVVILIIIGVAVCIKFI